MWWIALFLGCDAAVPPTPDVTDPEPPALDAEPLFASLAGQQRDAGLLESYVDNPDLPADFSSYLVRERPMFVYDASLAAIAWLGDGRPASLTHAKAVLDGLVAIQASSGAVPSVVNAGTGASSSDFSTGNQAWVMLALLAGHDALGDEAYLLAAERVAAHVLACCVSAADFGGLTLRPGSTVLSTEHNLDAYAAFTRLSAKLPTRAGLLTAAEVEAAATGSRLFAESMFDPVTGAVFTGSIGDGRTASRSPVPLDTQTWALLSLGRADGGYRWALQRPPAGIWTTSPACAGVDGPSFSTADVGDVWAEGLAQVATAALRAEDLDTFDRAAEALNQLRIAAPNADGQGLVATCTTVDTGFESSYFNSLHVGATAWTAIAAVGVDPFWFAPLAGGLAAHPAAGLPAVRITPPADGTYLCSGDAPCRFTVDGDASGLAGTGRQAYLLVEPLGFGSWFTQAFPATVAADGSFTVAGQLGSEAHPVSAGDEMRLLMLVVDGAAPPLSLSRIGPATVPGVLTASGVLQASVRR